jgi:hypothetical protein
MSKDEIPQIRPRTTALGRKERTAANTGPTAIPKLGQDRGDTNPSKKKKNKWKILLKKKYRKVVLGGAAFLVLLLILIIVPSFAVYKKAQILYGSTQKVAVALAAQNLPEIKTELQNTEEALSNLKSSFKLLSWTRFLPFLGAYIRDADHALNAADYGLEAAELFIVTIEPYADIIGFSGSDKAAEAGDGQKTTQERLDFVVKAIPEIIPKADELVAKVKIAKEEIDYIDPARYPVSFFGRPVRERLEKVLHLADQGANIVVNGKPLLEVAPYLLGVEEPRTYLILFQNDKELRPTGGFLTAYSIARVENGKFEPVSSNDMYNLDGLYTASIIAPEPIVKYLKGPYIAYPRLRLRDINWNPDFYESMEVLTTEMEKVGIKNIDGVIAVDTQVLVYLLDVLGPIGVSGFGNYSTEIVPECNCPQVIYELESFADIEGPVVWSENEPGKIVYAPAHMDNRKKIIGPLMNSILANAMGQPKDKLPDLFEAAYKSLMEKHVLFYLFNAEAQSAVESFGIAGRIDKPDGDYLHINDANLGGRKSNLYVQQEVVQEVSKIRGSKIEKTVTITYKNPEKHDGWLNSVLPNWVRVYVPKGSELISFEGVEDKVSYEESGKTVFAGFFELRPQGVAKVTLRYQLPFEVEDEYRLFIQKQPGTNAPLYSIKVGKIEEEFFLKTDKELKYKI